MCIKQKNFIPKIFIFNHQSLGYNGTQICLGRWGDVIVKLLIPIKATLTKI